MEELEFHAYAERLASSAPTPGGGSAAAVVGALGAALCAMVARITAEGTADQAKAASCAAIVEEADRLRRALLVERALDELAFGMVIAAMALPKETPEEKAIRTLALQDALASAAAAPLGVARRAAAVMALADLTLGLENRNLISDVRCAAEFAAACLAASAANVRINHAYLKDRALIDTQAGELAELEDSANRHAAHIREATDKILRPIDD
jgi:methenyltetrahydrofolate cyclohydrolase